MGHRQTAKWVHQEQENVRRKTKKPKEAPIHVSDPSYSQATDPRLEAAYARGRIARKKILRAEGGSISTDKAALRLGIQRATLLQLYRDGLVIGWRELGEATVHFPVWQFRGRELLPGLSRVRPQLGPRTQSYAGRSGIGVTSTTWPLLWPKKWEWSIGKLLRTRWGLAGHGSKPSAPVALPGGDGTAGIVPS